jgi:tetratricopeptide (TPR) repeat protein
MGNNLMGPSFANRNGHFEDIPMVNLHDRLLNINATDWRYFADEPLTLTAGAIKEMRQYLEQRKKTVDEETLIGAKDPRAVLFLAGWHKATDGHLKTLMVFRDWRLSVSSLLKRHSRQLIQYSGDANKREIDMQFWLTPDLAAQMWISSARAMLRWFKQHPADTLLFDQASFVAKPLELAEIASKKRFEPSLLKCRTYEQGLLQSAVPESMQGMISKQMRIQCDAIQQQLFECSDVNHKEYVSTHASDKLVTPLLKQAAIEINIGSLPDPYFARPVLENLTWQDLLSCLTAYNATQAKLVDWEALLSDGKFDANQLDKLYALLMKWSLNKGARQAVLTSISLKPQPWRYMYLGDVDMREKQYSEAKKNYNKAVEISPANATFYARLANVETAQDNYENAQALIDKALELDPTKPAILQAINYLKDSRIGSERRPSNETMMSNTTGGMFRITDYQTVVDAMAENREHGMKLDKYMCQSAFVLRDNRKWFINALSVLPVFARACFADYTLMHLNKIFPVAALTTELLLEDTNSWELTEHYLFDVKESSGLPSVGICIHAFYPHLLPQVFSYIANIPNIRRIVVTCSIDAEQRLKQALSKNLLVEVTALNNKGRDILPWLTIAAEKLSEYDLVLKLHTKKTPHQPELAGWRNQLYWQLMDNDFCLQTLQAFADNDNLGMVIPNYHPTIVRDVNWGQNFDIAQTIAQHLDIHLPEDNKIFPAGSMFWYRPNALSALTTNNWRHFEFPEEAGQTDGTIIHAIERIIGLVAEHSGYRVSLVSEICS